MNSYESGELGTEGIALARRIGALGWEYELVAKVATVKFQVGEWDDALRMLDVLIAESPEPGELVDPLHLAVKIRASRGDDVEEALASIDRLEPLLSDPQVLWAGFDARAFAAMISGDLLSAAQQWREIARRFQVRSFEWLFWCSALELRLGDLDAAAAALADLEALHLHAPVVRARRDVLSGCHAVASGRPEEGTRLALAGFESMRTLGLAVEQGFVAILFATVLDPAAPGVTDAIQRGRGQLVALGARVLVDQLDAAVARRDRERPTANAAVSSFGAAPGEMAARE